jgi:adenylosuccinate lyase
MALDPLEALSPIDGRYASSAAALRAHLSEAALIRERIRIEAEWLLALHREKPAGLEAASTLSENALATARQLASQPPEDAARAVKKIEQRTNHDVKAVEYYVRDQLTTAGASAAALELVHFGCTSEDINNLAYARMLQSARTAMLAEWSPALSALRGLSARYAALPMLSRTHGQTASPTTLGKEFANVIARLDRAIDRWRNVAILGKWNGAVGNFNAHVAALPAADWPGISGRFIQSLGLEVNPLTTQIEPHDWIAEYCDQRHRHRPLSRYVGIYQPRLHQAARRSR